MHVRLVAYLYLPAIFMHKMGVVATQTECEMLPLFAIGINDSPPLGLSKRSIFSLAKIL